MKIMLVGNDAAKLGPHLIALGHDVEALDDCGTSVAVSRARAVDVIHALGITDGVSIAQAAQQGRLVLSLSSPPGEPAGRTLAASATRVIVPCHDDAHLLADQGIEASRIAVIAPAVDTGLFAPSKEPRMPGPLRLLSVGALSAGGGMETAMRALSFLPEAQLTIIDAGANPDSSIEAARLRHAATSLGVEHRIRYLPSASPARLAQHMRAADLLLALPLRRPQTATIVEAMACGLPVVGTAVGGLLDVVSDEVGRLVPPGRAAMVAAAVRSLRSDDRARMSAAGARRARQHHSGPRIAAATAEVYAAAVSAKRPPVREGSTAG